MPIISRYLKDSIRIRLIQISTVALKGNLWVLMDCKLCFGFLTPLSNNVITLYNFYSHVHTSKARELCILAVHGLVFVFTLFFWGRFGPFGWRGRFDIEGDDETQANFTSQERTQIPSSLIPSPPRPAEPRKCKQQTNNASATHRTES